MCHGERTFIAIHLYKLMNRLETQIHLFVKKAIMQLFLTFNSYPIREERGFHRYSLLLC